MLARLANNVKVFVHKETLRQPVALEDPPSSVGICLRRPFGLVGASEDSETQSSSRSCELPLPRARSYHTLDAANIGNAAGPGLAFVTYPRAISMIGLE